MKQVCGVLVLGLVLVLVATVVGAGEIGDTHLVAANEHWRAFRLEPALQEFQTAVSLDPTPETYGAAADFLLAMRFGDRAEALLGEALAAYPTDPRLLEQRAALSALQGDLETAAAFVALSQEAGAPHDAWLDRAPLLERATEAPLCALLDPTEVTSRLAELSADQQVAHLRVLRGVLTPAAAPAVVELLLASDDTRVLRAGLTALASLQGKAAQPFAQLLARGDARLRALTLRQIRQLGSEELIPVLDLCLATESDPSNADLAQVALAELRAARLTGAEAGAALAAVPQSNTFHYLVLYRLADLAAESGRHDAAQQLRQAARFQSPALKAADGDLQRYWQCMERSDLQEISELTYSHAWVEPIDATVYGLPRNDFDDRRALSIAERLFLRSWFHLQGQDLPESGPLQYPREARHLLRRIQAESGTLVDCSGNLVGLPENLGEDGGEIKLQEDNGGDNEVNIVVNPYSPQYLVATSNDYGGAGGNDLYRSSNWGNSWSTGDVPGSWACDPVSFYNRTETGSGVKDIVYHSYLNGPNLKYSTDNGATWTACAAAGSGGDRQDMAIDTNQSSPCANNLYVAWQSGNQVMRASSGTSFPFCQTWKTQDTTGVSSTIGSAIVVSTNGVAQNIFTQYGSPGGVYSARTTDCGTTWLTESKLFNINKPGTFEWPIPSTCTRQVYYYPQADADRQASSAYLNNVYVVWNDLSSNCNPPGCSGNTTCNNDVYFGVGVPNDRSNPTSWTWSSYNLTDSLSDDYTDEFYPSLTVDQADGAVYVSYYRTGSGASNITPRKTQVHYVLLRSLDAGATWEGPYQVTDLPTDESGNGADSSMQWGDYTWNDVVQGVCYPSWTDRRETQDEDIWASKVCSEPAHWTERAPTFTPPTITVANGTGTAHVDISWPAPDIYWGDGGENNASRKYQLWVDGSLAQDNVLWTTTAIDEYSIGDCNPHSYVVRAVNQCGVSKDYATLSFTATNCCSNPNPAPAITGISDDDTCAQSGIRVTYTPSSDPSVTRHDLVRDSAVVVTGYVSNALYNPGDTASHSYQVRAIAGACSTDSPSQAASDGSSAPAAPAAPSVADADTCAQSGVLVSWGTVPGATGYDLWVDATTLISSVTSPYAYNPGNTASHSYQVRAKIGTCAGSWSTTGTGSDGVTTAGTTTVRVYDLSPCVQTGVTVAWDPAANATSYDLRVDGGSPVTNITSPYLFNPGDLAVHTYEIRAVNAACGPSTWSAPVSSADGTPFADIVLCDGFETGNTAGWSFALP